MARLYSNENVALRLVTALRSRGHDVLTSLDAGNANLGIPDSEVLAYAHEHRRVVLTGNRLDFHRLHLKGSDHSGIVTFTDDADLEAMAERVDLALQDPLSTGRFCARATKGGHSFL